MCFDGEITYAVFSSRERNVRKDRNRTEEGDVATDKNTKSFKIHQC